MILLGAPEALQCNWLLTKNAYESNGLDAAPFRVGQMLDALLDVFASQKRLRLTKKCNAQCSAMRSWSPPPGSLCPEKAGHPLQRSGRGAQDCRNREDLTGRGFAGGIGEAWSHERSAEHPQAFGSGASPRTVTEPRYCTQGRKPDGFGFVSNQQQ